VVLGSEIATALFPEGDAVGQDVRVSLAAGRISLNFTVLGVMAPKGGSGGGVQDAYIFVPISTLSGRIISCNASGVSWSTRST
jgi:hypothetical protein